MGIFFQRNFQEIILTPIRANWNTQIWSWGYLKKTHFFSTGPPTWMVLEPQLIHYAVICPSGCHQNSRKLSKVSPSYINIYSIWGLWCTFGLFDIEVDPTWTGLEHHLIHTKPWFAPQEVIRNMKVVKHLICVWNWCKSIRSPHEWSWASVVWPVPLGGNENSMSMEDS